MAIDTAAGDLVAVPSWVPLTMTALSDVDLFRFSDSPIFERLHANRVEVGLPRWQ